MERALLLLCTILSAGCAAVGAPGAPLLAIPAAVEGLSLRAFGRTTGDSLVSLVTGEDCSIARIGRGEAYCGRDDAPEPPPTCTRSLGAVDCWTAPPAAWPPHRGVADGPTALSRAQENDRIGWIGRMTRRRPAAAAPPAETAGRQAVPALVPVIEAAPQQPGSGTGAASSALRPGAIAADAARQALDPSPPGANP